MLDIYYVLVDKTEVPIDIYYVLIDKTEVPIARFWIWYLRIYCKYNRRGVKFEATQWI
jgi:hypothetical protein